MLERCREQIADVAAVPVLNLHDGPDSASAAEQRARPARQRELSRTAAAIDRHEVARLPWERRMKRHARRAAQEPASVA